MDIFGAIILSTTREILKEKTKYIELQMIRAMEINNTGVGIGYPGHVCSFT